VNKDDELFGCDSEDLRKIYLPGIFVIGALLAISIIVMFLWVYF
jgi:hypothetical protein